MTRTFGLAMVLVAVLSGGLVLAQGGGTSASAQEGTPATIPLTRHYDISSKVNGQTYRLWITTPEKVDPSVSYPVFYAIDGNELEGTLAYVGREFAWAGGNKPAVLVGIGYPTDDLGVWRVRRQFDLTPSVGQPRNDAVPTGGMDAFIRVLLDEIKPFVEARFKIDPTQQTIWGHSLGGLTVTRLLFRNPTAFNVFCISSPSLWWNEGEVLADEPAFAKRARAGELDLRISVNSAGEEDGARMVDKASELAGRLAALNPERIKVTRTIFAGEVHRSAVSVSLIRSLRFALSRSDTR